MCLPNATCVILAQLVRGIDTHCAGICRLTSLEWCMPNSALLCCRYTRADGIAMLILRRSDVMSTPRWAAREPYAQVVNIGTNNDGHTKEGITFPSSHAQGSLARQASCLSSYQSIKQEGCPQDTKVE